jgi:hypothetical protein
MADEESQQRLSALAGRFDFGGLDDLISVGESNVYDR